MDLGLGDKVAVVTGGIGLGVARAFAREGAHVFIAARGEARAEAEALHAEYGVETASLACDVATAEGYLQDVADAHAPTKRFGTVEELADFMVFLCSPRASYAVGSTSFYDGGMLRTT